MMVLPAASLDPKLAPLRDLWVDCLRKVLSQVAGFAVTVEAETEEQLGAGDIPESQVWTLFGTSKALQGEMALLATDAGAVQLAQVLMSEPPNAAVPLDAGRREAYEELLRQVIGQLATSLKSVAGSEVEIRLSGNAPPAWQSGGRAGIRIGGGKLAPLRLVLSVSKELAASFPAFRENQSLAPTSPKNSSTPQPELSPAQNANLELLLDVTLDATICFGQKEMLLREILELHPGAAVVLDRHVEEPVDLLVGGRMVARGEVVIVDGNYGLRITEIVCTQQRVASLMK